MSKQASRNQHNSLVPFFVITFAITWGLAALLLLFPEQMEALFGELSLSNPIFILAVAAPTITATLLTYRQAGWAGLRDLYARILRWRVGVQWWAAVLVGLPLIAFLVILLAGPEPTAEVRTPGAVLLLVLNLLILGPLGEEFGWRGYALPRLLQRFNPFVASLILGAIWGLWHFPSFFMSGVPQGSLSISVFLVGALCLSFLVTWLFIHTNGSLIIVILFHLVVNVMSEVFGTPFPPFVLALAITAALVVVLDRRLGWFRRGESALVEADAQAEGLQQLEGAN